MFVPLKKFLARLEAIDLWFLGLRLVTILVGIAWYVWVPYEPADQSIFALLLWGIGAYTAILCAGIFLWPGRINSFYLVTLVIDLGFIFFFLRHVARLDGSFFVAFYLLIGLHSFYFGPPIGVAAATVTAGLYSYLYFDFGRPLPVPEFMLRIAFLFLVAGSFGLLSVKGRRDTEKIEKLNQQLARRNEVLMQVYRYLSISKLAPGIAERVNNSMGIIVGRAAVLQREAQKCGIAQDLLDGLGVILHHANHLASVFRNLVTFLAAGSAERRMVDLNEIVKDALWVMEGGIEERQVKLERNLSPSPMFILGAAQELKEAIVHLLSNALDALPQGGVVQVETARETRSPEQVILRIADNGVGIKKQDMVKIFNPFFSTKATGNGIGLGLSVALNSIKGHNGIMSIQSEWGKGTRLTVSFPPYDSAGEGTS
jgi:signal transduction histidine kinase